MWRKLVRGHPWIHGSRSLADSSGSVSGRGTGNAVTVARLAFAVSAEGHGLSMAIVDLRLLLPPTRMNIKADVAKVQCFAMPSSWRSYAKGRCDSETTRVGATSYIEGLVDSRSGDGRFIGARLSSLYARPRETVRGDIDHSVAVAAFESLMDDHSSTLLRLRPDGTGTRFRQPYKPGEPVSKPGMGDAGRSSAKASAGAAAASRRMGSCPRQRGRNVV
ncbi:hypothetical protein EJ07DRAFT_153060 [Lizonia empirigonia]|nr:hypothetical protein EJ07DRAFT_153060 [Lizonia empirigonia]